MKPLDQAVREYKKGMFSTEEAARFAKISVWEFLDVLKERKEAVMYDSDELKEDLKSLKLFIS